MNAPAPSEKAAQGAIISTPVDFLLIGGLSIAHYFVLLVFGSSFNPETVMWFAALSVPLTWVINNPHFSATSWRLYRSKSDMQQFPVTAFILPVFMTLLTAIALLSPQEFGPWYIKFYLLWSPYHFSAQTLGVALLYARRSNFQISPGLRKLLTFFIFSTFLGPSLRAEQSLTGATYYGIVTPSFHLPDWVWPVFQYSMWGLGVLLLAALVISARAQLRKTPPLFVVLLPLVQYVWFVAGSGVNGFTEYVPAYHSLQYLTIAWLMELRTRQCERKIAPSRFYVGSTTTLWAAANVVGGLVLFAGLPWLAAKATGLDPFMTTGFVIAGVQMHHFFVDGVIWKLKNPAIGSPLLATLGTLTGRTAHA